MQDCKVVEFDHFSIESYLTLIHRQFCPNLALANHTPHEVMRVSAIFAQKKWKKFVTLTWHKRGMGRFVSKVVYRDRNVWDFVLMNWKKGTW